MDLVIAFVAGMFALPWMWLALASLVFVTEVACSHNEDFFLATLISFFSVALIGYFGADLNVFTWAWQHPLELIQFSVVYLFIGGVWSTFKWYQHRISERDYLNQKIDKWERTRADRQEQLAKNVESGHKPGNRDQAWSNANPRPTREFLDTAEMHMDNLCGWVAHWPFSMLGYLIGDFLIRIVKRVVNWFSGIYQRIDEHVFHEIDVDEQAWNRDNKAPKE
jgi:hypothetical protein